MFDKWLQAGTRRLIAVSGGLLIALAVLIVVLAGPGMPGAAESRKAGAGSDPPGRVTGTPVTADPTPTPTRDTGPAPLLPNLRSEPAEDISIRVVDGVRQLWFASIIANTGVGPLETDPDALRACPVGQRHASQAIYQDGNANDRYDRDVDTVATRRPAGCMLFHPAHDHWHFDKAARYVLTHPGNRESINARDKVSFCWRDRRPAAPPTTPRPTKHYGECERDRVQGIGPGWADVYSTRLRDQYLELPAAVADGIYCLLNESDPLDLLAEANEDDNAAVVPLSIAGTTVTPGPPGACAETSD